ncbi:MAG: serine hydrolase [Bacteroidia bacterium]|nr:serine hydrolase [Bacteroidia bacterium]
MGNLVKYCIFLLLLPSYLGAQNGHWPREIEGYGPLEGIFRANVDSFARVGADPQRFRLQVIYTQIDRDAQNVPSFRHYGYRVDTTEYFYPASLVKLPVAALCLEKLNLLNRPGINRETLMRVDAENPCEIPSWGAKRVPESVGQYIRKIFLVSDNDAFNRLFEFVGRRHLNERLWALGYTSARIGNRFSKCSTAQNQYSQGVSFLNSQGQILLQQKGESDPTPLTNPFGKVYLGEAHEDPEGKIVPIPFDFTGSNFVSLWDFHRLLMSIIFPESVPESRRMVLTDDDLKFLRTYMSMLPQECSNPVYDPEKYFQCYVKYLMFGRKEKASVPESIRIFNKVGLSHGFVSDVAYVADYENKVEFFLSAVVYVNDNQTVNDGTYEYEEVGFPFMKNLGQAVYTYELNRTKTNLPDFTGLRDGE